MHSEVPNNLHFHYYPLLSISRHYLPFFFLSCIKLATKVLILKTICISSDVCLDNHMKLLSIVFHCKSCPKCQKFNLLLLVHVVLNSSFNCSYILALTYTTSIPSFFFHYSMILLKTSLSNTFHA